MEYSKQVSDVVSMQVASKPILDDVQEQICEWLKTYDNLSIDELIIRNKDNLVLLENRHEANHLDIMIGILMTMKQKGTLENKGLHFWKLAEPKAAIDFTALKREIVNLFSATGPDLLSRDAITNKTRDTLVTLEEQHGISRHRIVERQLEEMVKTSLLFRDPNSYEENPRYGRGTTPAVWPFPDSKIPRAAKPITEPVKEFKMPEATIDPKDFQKALEIIALDFLGKEIDELNSSARMVGGPVTSQIGILQRIRGTIKDHGLEFRLSKEKSGHLGIPPEICKVQLVKTLYPMDADLLSSIVDLFHNEGH